MPYKLFRVFPFLGKISELFKKNEIHIEIRLGKGQFSEKVWGCDLTEEYVKTNAYYTT
jgi:glutamate N-acetyltransferase/amino-acid N-acetyltransferase